MKKSLRFLLATASVLMVLLLSAVHPLTAYADDAAPPPEATSAPTEETPGEPAEQDVSAAEIIEQVPEGTKLVILDENGESLPLASEQAAEVLAAPDPSFTVAAVVYNFTSADCDPFTALLQPCTSPIQAAVNALNGTSGTSLWAGTGATPDDGNIYVEAGTYEGVAIDGATGWNSGANTPAYLGLIGAGSGVTTVDGYILIFNMNSFTLSGFSVVDAVGPANLSYVWADGNAGDLQITDLVVTNSGGNGMQVLNHSGDIDLTNVTSDSSSSNGAYLDNTDGSGDITIDPSSFSSNGAYGLIAYSNGNISLADVTADNNVNTGAYLYNGFPSLTTTIAVDTGQFNSNGGDGLDAYSNGDISISNVTADGNDATGAKVYNAFVGATGTVTIDPSQFNSNGASGGDGGLHVTSNGDISLTDVIASSNVFGGAFLDNSDGAGNISVNVFLSAFSQFSSNGFDGLVAYSSGDITLTNVIADLNGDVGAHLDNTYGTGNVLVDPSQFSDNGEVGLEIYSKGNISLADVTASDNYSSGAFLNNCFWNGLSCDGTGFIQVDTGEFGDNGGYGLFARSYGDITLTDVYAHDNGLNGAYLENTFGTANIYVNVNVLAESDFSWNGGHGLAAYSFGDITLTDVYAHDNDLNGADLNNPYSSATGSIDVNASEFSLNGWDGLNAASNENITLTEVYAYDNAFSGAYLDNLFGTGDILVDPSEFSGNGWDGLDAFSNGDITLQEVMANDNGGYGAYLDNSCSCSAGNIFVDKAQFGDGDLDTIGNGFDGLVAYSAGNITLNDVNAHDNLGDGAYLDNTLGTGDIVVTASFFTDGTDSGTVGNTGDGLELWTCGNATVGTTELAFNGGYGLNANVGGTYTEGVLVVGGNVLGDTLINMLDCSSQKKPGLVFPSLPLNIVPVTGGEGVGLDCELFRGTMLVLPNGDSLTFLCPIQGDASARSLEGDGLPGDLPEDVSFGSSLLGALTGGDSEPLPGKVIASFVIPAGMEDDDLAILFWDGNAWVDLHEASFDDGRTVYDGGHDTGDGHFEAVTNFTGTFVLVSK